MADVTPPWQRASADGRLDRGQLFLVGALALAVLFIALALLLNTAIYTENLATRSDGTHSTEIIGYQSSAQAHSSAELQRINRKHNSTYDHLATNYTQTTRSWEETAAVHRAAEGHVAELSVTDTTNGTRIVQDSEREFSDANSSADWQLAADVNVRNYTMTAQANSLTISDTGNLSADPVFRILFNASGSDTWAIYVYDGTLGDVTVAVQAPNGTVVDARGAGTEANLDVTNATLNGDHWSALEFFDEFDGGYDVDYEYGNATTGTYELTVDRPIGDAAIDESHYHDDNSQSPYVTPALYDAEHVIIYQTPSAYYEASYRIAPGEPNA